MNRKGATRESGRSHPSRAFGYLVPPGFQTAHFVAGFHHRPMIAPPRAVVLYAVLASGRNRFHAFEKPLILVDMHAVRW